MLTAVLMEPEPESAPYKPTAFTTENILLS